MRANRLSNTSRDLPIQGVPNVAWASPQSRITGFFGSPVYTLDRQGDWTVGQRQGVLLKPKVLLHQARPQRTHWVGFLSSRRSEEDDEAQRDSKASRSGEKVGSDRSRSPTKSAETAHGRTSKKPKPLKPGIY